ncbi:MAG: hypothetical protein CAPSK01_000881 [Candidatus Accumulibacter vicinus]|uniref:Uncharacterized protein n=1 Tax=Candidatus Accumulibacter vicinus TaxID=2954382 RepID=A0A084Y3W3_9PROT|nr:MAG: hypothetical protein CAPSK01_000881 [Candidatus Accumulibacter vicinus]
MDAGGGGGKSNALAADWNLKVAVEQYVESCRQAESIPELVFLAAVGSPVVLRGPVLLPNACSAVPGYAIAESSPWSTTILIS